MHKARSKRFTFKVLTFLYRAISNAQGLFKALYIQGSDGRATHGATHFLDIIGNMELSIFPKDTR